MEKNIFLPLLKEFIKTPKGKFYFNMKTIGIIEGKLKYFYIIISAKGVTKGGYDMILP